AASLLAVMLSTKAKQATRGRRGAAAVGGRDDSNRVGLASPVRWVTWIIRSRHLPAATTKQKASEEPTVRWAQEETARRCLCADQRSDQSH
ncbi:hypothetical protein ACLOJK_036431, partial [Asimina triloba]